MAQPPTVPNSNGEGTHPSKLTTGEVAALQVEAKKEDAKRAPASHWDLVKSTIAIIGTLAGITLGFVTFGDRVVARSEAKTADGVKAVERDLSEHIAIEAQHHEEVKEVLRDFTSEMKEQRADIKALYRAMPNRRMQTRLEVDVRDPTEEDAHVLGISGPAPMVTPMPRPRPDAGR